MPLSHSVNRIFNTEMTIYLKSWNFHSSSFLIAFTSQHSCFIVTPGSKELVVLLLTALTVCWLANSSSPQTEGFLPQQLLLQGSHIRNKAVRGTERLSRLQLFLGSYYDQNAYPGDTNWEVLRNPRVLAQLRVCLEYYCNPQRVDFAVNSSLCTDEVIFLVQVQSISDRYDQLASPKRRGFTFQISWIFLSNRNGDLECEDFLSSC